jgi:hypothetical protein
MIAGWAEVAKVTGVGAPERKEVVIEGSLTEETLGQASDAELLALLEKRRHLPLLQETEIVDAEYQECELVGAESPQPGPNA